MSVAQKRRTRLGRRGESEAAAFYRRRGAEVLDRNVSYPVGELDLICREPDGTIVFVEVKTRSGRGFGGAEAARWLEGREYARVRFDVLVFTTIRHGFDVEFYEGVEHGAR